MRRLAPLLLAPLLACASPSGSTAPAPAYTPVNTPEAQTSCPDEAARAKTAREAAVGEETLAPGAAAAAAVFGHAECERRAFDAITATGGDELTLARQQLQSTRNLYAEAANYQVPRWAVLSRARLGDLYDAWATKVRAVAPAPGDDGLLFAAERDEAAGLVEREAAAAWREALASASAWGTSLDADADVQRALELSCAGLTRVAPDQASAIRRCGGR